MTARAKVSLMIAGVALAGATFFALRARLTDSGVAVQTARIGRRDLVQIVTASGEIKPKNYINVGADQMGRITEVRVVEGDAVRRGQVLAQLETIQPRADVDAQAAGLELLKSEAKAQKRAIEASLAAQRAQEASLLRAQAEADRARLLFERARDLIEDGLISRDEFDRRRADDQAARAAIVESQANLAKLEAQHRELEARAEAAARRVEQAEAQLRRARDVLNKHSTVAPLDGIVTNLPVRVGETVVPGIQNSPASLIMTIADMSVITAEVLADETDIVYVEVGQSAEIAVDALPDRKLAGKVIELGNTAILRSTGLAASQTEAASQEARDFKVTIAVENPPNELRPGMSCTARVTTARRGAALTVPIQALTVREGSSGEDLEGVFAVVDGVAEFRAVETGISGGGDIEVVDGLAEGDEIVIGGYQVLRELRSGTRVKAEAPPAR